MLHTGQTIGAYRIGPLLGSGGMGLVYAGVRLADDHPVAIKALHQALLVGSERDTILRRFRLEADIGQRLRHPGIVAVHEQGQFRDDLYLVMDRVEGDDLRKRLGSGQPLALELALDIALQVLTALAHAHGHGVIHRDIKPGNILVREDHSVVIMDFGIARLEDSDLTSPGEMLGSMSYMAPEQFRGSGVDQRTDLFAVGVVLYEMLTGWKPFASDSLPNLLAALQRNSPTPPSRLNTTLPEELDPVILKALSKHTDQRITNAMAFANALRRVRDRAVERGLVGTKTSAFPGTPSGGVEQPTETLPPLQSLLVRIDRQLVECLESGVTRPRLRELNTCLEGWFTLLGQREDPEAGEASSSMLLKQLLDGELRAGLGARLLAEAPLPGKALVPARGDWLEQVELLELLARTTRRLGNPTLADQLIRIVQSLTRSVRDYARQLDLQLSGVDSPPLARISADFLRLEILQMGLDILASDEDRRYLQQLMLRLATRVMEQVNTIMGGTEQDLQGPGRRDIDHLLQEMEELIVLVECLLAWEIGLPIPGRRTPGGVVMREFVNHTRRLAENLAQELLAQFENEELAAREAGPAAFGDGQEQFLQRLRQLGMLYRLALRLGPVAPSVALRKLGDEVHHDLESISTFLIAALEHLLDPDYPRTGELLWRRLALIDELAEQFGWQALHQQVVLAARWRLGSLADG